jgi:hypothetical protein
MLLIVALWPGASFAEKPADPDSVAPECRGPAPHLTLDAFLQS